MSVFLGLFTNLDRIISGYDVSEIGNVDPLKPSGAVLTKPGEVLYALEKGDCDCEHVISRRIYDFLSERFPGKVQIGGNAGNAAVTLSELGVESVLSCPMRPEKLLRMLGRHKGIRIASSRRIEKPADVRQQGTCFEHLCFEKGRSRKIFTFDPASCRCEIDGDFWNNVGKDDLLWLGGLHLVSWRCRKKIDMIADSISESGCRVHLETGEDTSAMRYAIKVLSGRRVLDSLGMNEFETKLIGLEGKELGDKGDCLKGADSLSDFAEESGLERVTVHSKDYRFTFFRKGRERNVSAGKESVRISQAKMLGGIKKNLHTIPYPAGIREGKAKGGRYVIIPTLKRLEPRTLTGLGDTSSVIDALVALSPGRPPSFNTGKSKFKTG